ncbi:hypothetical protein ACI1JB_004862 [Escherichia coli]
MAWQDLRVVDWSRFGPMSRICVWFALPSFGEWSDLDFIDFIGKSKMSYGCFILHFCKFLILSSNPFLDSSALCMANLAICSE